MNISNKCKYPFRDEESFVFGKSVPGTEMPIITTVTTTTTVMLSAF